MKEEKIKAFVTQYALTKGVLTVDAKVINDTMISYESAGYGGQYAHGNDWHRTHEAALARAEEMRAAKIVSLKKSIAKMERMTFAAPNVELTGAAPHGKQTKLQEVEK